MEKNRGLPVSQSKVHGDDFGGGLSGIRADERNGSISGSELCGQHSIRTTDFDGLLSLKSVSHRSKSCKSAECGRSIHDSDFGALFANCVGLEDQYPFHGDDEFRLDDAPDEDANPGESLTIDDIINGVIPEGCSPEKMVEVLEVVLDRNKRLQKEMAATLDSIDEAITNNSKARQLAEALQSMRLSRSKSARPASSSGMAVHRTLYTKLKVLMLRHRVGLFTKYMHCQFLLPWAVI